MSLQVWLPLTKDLRQQGLAGDYQVSTSTATITTGGKLGQCYNFTATTGNGIFLNNDVATFMDTYINNHSWSLCAWVKNNINNGDTAVISLTYGLRLFAGSRTYVSLYNSSRSMNCDSNIGTGDNFWHHIVATYNVDTNVINIYVDGTKTGSANYTSGYTYASSWTNGLFIGRDPNNSTANAHYFYQGQMNDVRIYDHCLSPMEVKELAKGLVLHYPLNRNGWGQENLVDNSDFSNLTTSGYIIKDTTVLFHGKPTCKISRTGATSNTYTGWSSQNLFSRLTPGSKVTVSVWVYRDSNHGIDSGCEWRMYQRYNNDASTDWTGFYSSANWPIGEWKQFKYTYTIRSDISSAYLNFNVVKNGTYWFAEPKVEKGEIVTSWSPSATDALYSKIGLNNTTEYDCSGFCNNGEKIGTLTYTSDTPKYQVSTHIGSTSSKIHISNFPTSGFGNSYSFVWWGKRSSNGPMFWGFSDGIRLNGMYAGTLWNTGDSSSNPIYVPGTTTTITAPSVNVWHHYVMTGDGTTCKLYVDGVLYGQAKTYKAISGTSIWINGWDSSTSYCSDNTDMSDFRIYATALSADDVKSLYQNCATIDPDGTIRGQIRS